MEPDEAELDTVADLEDADPGDFGDLDPDDADLQAALTVLAVLADDISDAAGDWPTIWPATSTSRKYRTEPRTSKT